MYKGVRSQESGVRSQESGVRSQESAFESLTIFALGTLQDQTTSTALKYSRPSASSDSSVGFK